MSIRMMCHTCGSVNVTRDGLLRWSEPEQKWEMSSELQNADCDDCGGQTTIDEVPVKGNPICECDDCNYRGVESHLKPIKRLEQRVEAGEPMPSGECPNVELCAMKKLPRCVHCGKGYGRRLTHSETVHLPAPPHTGTGVVVKESGPFNSQTNPGQQYIFRHIWDGEIWLPKSAPFCGVTCKGKAADLLLSAARFLVGGEFPESDTYHKIKNLVEKLDPCG